MGEGSVWEIRGYAHMRGEVKLKWKLMYLCKMNIWRKGFSIKSMFYEFMKHKANEVNSGTVKRMMADWTRFMNLNDIVNIG